MLLWFIINIILKDFYSCNQGNVVISNDGATILKTLDIIHPAAKTLVDIAKSQDSEVVASTIHAIYS